VEDVDHPLGPVQDLMNVAVNIIIAVPPQSIVMKVVRVTMENVHPPPIIYQLPLPPVKPKQRRRQKNQPPPPLQLQTLLFPHHPFVVDVDHPMEPVPNPMNVVANTTTVVPQMNIAVKGVKVSMESVPPPLPPQIP